MSLHLFTDQLGREMLCSKEPKRIISLVPSQTELLFDLGLDEEIIGITKFCIHPKEKTKPVAKIGGTKTLNIDKIRRLKPDLIIGNKEENEQGQIELLMNEFPVWMSDIYTVEDALQMIGQLGNVVGKAQGAWRIAEKITTEFNVLISASSSPHPDPMPSAPCSSPSVAYFIWKNPYMIAGTNTFINSIITLAGWKNSFASSRYPQISAGELQEVNPDVILLSSEPYPFREKHIKEFQEICPGAQVIVVDGELFSWYGSRLQHTPPYLRKLKKQICDYSG